MFLRKKSSPFAEEKTRLIATSSSFLGHGKSSKLKRSPSDWEFMVDPFSISYHGDSSPPRLRILIRILVNTEKFVFGNSYKVDVKIIAMGVFRPDKRFNVITVLKLAKASILAIPPVKSTDV
jgi:hypothetical protein